jgi:hypothetical protein
MPMKRSFLYVLFLCLIYVIGEGQSSGQQLWKLKRYEASAGIGPSFFFCDIGGYSKGENILGFKDLILNQTRFEVNFNFKYRITSDVNVRMSLSYASLHASDAKGSNEERGFEVATSIFEPAIIGEYYFIKNQSESSWLVNKGRGSAFKSIFSKLDFYFFTGIGGVMYNLNPNDKLSETDPKTSGFSAVIPVGVGTSFNYTPVLNFGVELGGRYSFTDNLDGYTSQYSSSNDVYYFLNFTITYKMKTGANGLPSFR